MTYGVETWELKSRTISKLNSTEMDFWRRSARISRRDKIGNSVIKQQTNVQKSLIDFIKNKQLKWYGHVKRMTEDIFPRKVLEWVAPGRKRRRRGRPRITWNDGVLSCMRETGWKKEIRVTENGGEE